MFEKVLKIEKRLTMGLFPIKKGRQKYYSPDQCNILKMVSISYNYKIISQRDT